MKGQASGRGPFISLKGTAFRPIGLPAVSSPRMRTRYSPFSRLMSMRPSRTPKLPSCAISPSIRSVRLMAMPEELLAWRLTRPRAFMSSIEVRASPGAKVERLSDSS
jgi:hypothetical protein